MTDNDDSWNPTDVNRRHFLKATGLGATGAVAGLAGCSGGGGDEGTTEAETTSGGGGGDETETTTTSSGEPQQGGRLIWGHSEVTQNLDIHQTGTASTGRFLDSVYESMVGLTQDLELSTSTDAKRTGLAKDWEVSDDLMTYTFTLREGITFHDGSELTAEDVKYSYERIMNPDTGAIMSFVFDATESVETDGDYTVVVNQSEVYQPLLRQLAFSGTSIVPKDSGSQLGDQPIGTGPFKFNSRQQGNKAELEGYDDYWGEGPYLDYVEERTVTDPDSRLTGIQEGEFDLINDIPLDDINSVVGNDSDNLNTKKWTPLSWAFLNMNNNVEPFDDKKFRQAVDFAINKEELVEGALFGNGSTTASPSFPNSPFRNNDLEPRAQDLEEAKRLFSESQYNPGDYDLTFKVTTNYPWHVDAATIMQQYLNQAGLNVEIQKLKWSDWLSQVWINREFTLSMVNFFTFWEPAYMYTSLWSTDGSFNFRGYSSDEYDQTVAEAAKAKSRDEAISLYKEAQTILHEDVPDVMLWFRDGTLAAKDHVKGLDTVLSPNNSELEFGQVWLDQS
jgi:peptide/nickel transport system substrate-binding protein